jgi:hypothetical protein
MTLRSNGRLAPRGTLGSEALEHLAVGSDRHDGGHDRDPVLLGEVGPVADIHLEQPVTGGQQALLPILALRAERMHELDEAARGSVEARG